jgi:hypothetical protein
MFGGKQEDAELALGGVGQEVWPPSSPDYSFLDYFVWGVSEL